MSLRVLMVSQWYDPEGGSAAQAGVIARSLKRHGIEIEVLTGFPNYPTGDLAPGYRVRPYQREVLDGVTVHRVPLWPSHDSRATRRAANYLSWAASALVMGVLRAPPSDAVLVHSTPATAGAGTDPRCAQYAVRLARSGPLASDRPVIGLPPRRSAGPR